MKDEQQEDIIANRYNYRSATINSNQEAAARQATSSS